MCVQVFVCVCVCKCICMCVCACVRQRQRPKRTKRKKGVNGGSSETGKRTKSKTTACVEVDKPVLLSSPAWSLSFLEDYCIGELIMGCLGPTLSLPLPPPPSPDPLCLSWCLGPCGTGSPRILFIYFSLSFRWGTFV